MSEIFLTVFARIAAISTGFLASILTARYLGPAGRGEYYFVTTVIILITQFAHFGLASSNTYWVAKEPASLEKLIINSFWISIVIGTLAVWVVYVIFLMVYGNALNHFLICTILAPISILNLLGSNLLIGINKIKLFNYFQINSNLLILIFMFLAGLFGLHVTGFLVLNTLGWIAIVLFLFYCLWREVPIKKEKFLFDKAFFLKGASYSGKAYIVTLLGLLVLKGNIFILNYYFKPTSLGYYSVAAQVNDCFMIVPMSIALILFPDLVRNANESWEKMLGALKIVTLIMTITCTLSLVLLKPFIHIAFGLDFLPAVKIGWGMIPGTFFLGLISIISQYIAAIGYPKQVIYIWVVTFIFSILSSLVLIPLYHEIGAAISLSISYFLLFSMILTFAIHQKRSLSWVAIMP